MILSTCPAGVVLAYDPKGLVEAARGADCVVELAAEVGDFVAADYPLFRIYGGGQTLDERRLQPGRSISERSGTVEQDPLFGFRIIVDVASKALSPAINDPTTAVLAIDQIHHLLGLVGGRRLDDGHVRDARGALRLVYRTPDWEDFPFSFAVTEIRQFGGVEHPDRPAPAGHAGEPDRDAAGGADRAAPPRTDAPAAAPSTRAFSDPE